jgi:hypothetical protein
MQCVGRVSGACEVCMYLRYLVFIRPLLNFVAEIFIIEFATIEGPAAAFMCCFASGSLSELPLPQDQRQSCPDRAELKVGRLQIKFF